MKELIESAKTALSGSYSPYSKYAVGCAIATDKGIFTGANVENSSYGAAICAERSAVVKAVNSGAKTIFAAATASQNMPVPVPCGICLQVISEFAAADCIVIAVCGDKQNQYKFSELMPSAFKLNK